MLERHLYLRSPGPGQSLWLNAGYADGGPRRTEIRNVSVEDDAYIDWAERASDDNGRTWSRWRPIDGVVRDTPEGGIVTYPAVPQVDPRTGKAYRFTMRRAWPGQKAYAYDFATARHRFTDHMFVSEDGGPDRLLRYEDGPDFDPRRPFEPTFLGKNSAYFGTQAAFLNDGAVCFPLVCFGQSLRDRRGVCLMRRDPRDARWRPSNLQPIAFDLSCVGLEEPAATCLLDGAVLVVARGHATQTTPGVKWMSLSTDGGRTLSPFEEFRYDDGSRMYSPCSMHRFVRSGRNGRLYWIANIVDRPPEGQGPRYPLCIAEMDEANARVIRDSVVVLDDRRPGEPEALQLSNFSVVENRETLDLEIYVTLLGLSASDFWHGDVYRCTYSPPPPAASRPGAAAPARALESFVKP